MRITIKIKGYEIRFIIILIMRMLYSNESANTSKYTVIKQSIPFALNGKSIERPDVVLFYP
jgi:hypothetical protein